MMLFEIEKINRRSDNHLHNVCILYLETTDVEKSKLPTPLISLYSFLGLADK